MQRACFIINLVPGRELEYERRHATVWPDMVAALHECGIRNLTGFRSGTTVVYVAECTPDARTAYGRLEPTEVNQRWTRYFEGMLASREGEDGQLPFMAEFCHVD